MAVDGEALPEGIFSLIDTDLYKLTMQSAVLKYFPDVEVTYTLTNRTPDMRLNRRAFRWLEEQINRLANITITYSEITYLRQTCPYLSEPYLHYLQNFRLNPSKHVKANFLLDKDTRSDADVGDLQLHTEGLWLETILYEIPLLALTSEAYFKFVDRDWTYAGQREAACDKGLAMLQAGCLVSEFGSRRRRDYHTHALILQGLIDANSTARMHGWPGRITGTSNVHLAMKFGIPPIGTVAHEWFMGVAAVTDNYPNATETALTYWVATFGKGVLGIALTDTFGTPQFLEAFSRKVPSSTAPGAGGATTSASTMLTNGTVGGISDTKPPVEASGVEAHAPMEQEERFADVFAGTRQDSGDPVEFIRIMREYYDSIGIKTKKTIVFSDSLNTERCIEYREAAEKAGFQPSFGVGTFFTNDFTKASTGEKSKPLNIVIKLSSANGKPAIKISDNIGKNTGDSDTVKHVKEQLGYTEKDWEEGDESRRW